MASHAHIADNHKTEFIDNICIETIRPYIAADSTRAIHNTAIVRKNIDNEGLLDITDNDLQESIPSHIPTHNHANQIAKPGHTKFK